MNKETKEWYLESLKEQVEKADFAHRKAKAVYEKEIEKVQLPEIKKKFEGKYFKYLNRYGSGEKWFMYIHCKQVTSINAGVLDSFETTPVESSFELSKRSYLTLLGTPITKREYNAALKKFLSRAERLLAN